MVGCPTDEVRQLLLEQSNLKLKDSYSSSKIDVHCLLFTDFLLICKQISKRTSDRLKIVRQPFLVNRLRTHELKDQSGLVMIYLNELNVASTFFTLYTPDTRIWIQRLKEAKKLFKNLQQTSKEKEKLEQLNKNKPSLQIMKSTEDEYFDDYYDLSNTIQASGQHPLYLQQQQLLISSQFSSSRSSLIKSQSNSIDQSEASAYSSNLILAAPASTPNPLFNSQILCCSNCGQQIIQQQHQHTKQHQQTANQQRQQDQQSSFTSTTLGSISTIESCSICNLPNVFVNSTTTTNSNVLMTTGHSSGSNLTTTTKMQQPTNLQRQHHTTNTIKNQSQLFNPNQIHSKYLLNANMSLLPTENSQQRAISFELGELRNPSITVDDLDCLGRSQSMERPNHSPTFLRPERRAFLIKGRPTANTTGVPINATQLNAAFTKNSPAHLVAGLPSSSNSASIDSTTCSHQHYCSQCNNRISLSSSDNFNIVIAAGGLIDQNALNRSITTTTNSNSSLQPTHSQSTSYLRQVKSLDKEYNPSICEEEQFILPVPNIKTTAISNLPITTTTVSTTLISGNKKLMKMKNVNLDSVNVVLSSVNLVKSAPNSGESSPKNLSFDSDIGDLAISDPGNYTNYKSSTIENKEDDENKELKVSKKFYLTTDNSSIRSSTSIDEMDLNEQTKTGEFKLTNIPSFLIEEEIDKDKNDLNNNLN